MEGSSVLNGGSEQDVYRSYVRQCSIALSMIPWLYSTVSVRRSLCIQRDRYQVINDALNSTLCRTFNTSLTTLVVSLLCIFIFIGVRSEKLYVRYRSPRYHYRYILLLFCLFVATSYCSHCSTAPASSSCRSTRRDSGNRLTATRHTKH